MTQLDTRISEVENWADQRGLISTDRTTILAQLGKTMEELGETASAVLKRQPINIQDGIGDVTVCLIILAAQHGMRFEKCLEAAYNEIKNRHGKTVAGTFIKEADKGVDFKTPDVRPTCGVCEQHLKDCLCD